MSCRSCCEIYWILMLLYYKGGRCGLEYAEAVFRHQPRKSQCLVTFSNTSSDYTHFYCKIFKSVIYWYWRMVEKFWLELVLFIDAYSVLILSDDLLFIGTVSSNIFRPIHKNIDFNVSSRREIQRLEYIFPVHRCRRQKSTGNRIFQI